jgi:hypothetical protein
MRLPPMRRLQLLRHTRVLLAAIAIAAPLAMVAQGSASASTPCHPLDWDPYTQTNAAAVIAWTPPDDTTGGIRAPVQVRRDGRECDFGAGYTGVGSAIWIAIENQDASGLVQVGFLREYDHHSTFDEVRFCKMKEVYPEEPSTIPFDCGSVGSDDTFVYFEVNRVGGGYRIYDCGVGDPTYTSCGTAIDSRSSTYPKDFAVEAAENNSGSCYDEVLGSSGDADNVGTTTHQSEIQDNLGSWTPRNMTGYLSGHRCNDGSGVSYYQYHVQSAGVDSFYDTRNTS